MTDDNYGRTKDTVLLLSHCTARQSVHSSKVEFWCWFRHERTNNMFVVDSEHTFYRKASRHLPHHHQDLLLILFTNWEEFDIATADRCGRVCLPYNRLDGQSATCESSETAISTSTLQREGSVPGAMKMIASACLRVTQCAVLALTGAQGRCLVGWHGNSGVFQWPRSSFRRPAGTLRFQAQATPSLNRAWSGPSMAWARPVVVGAVQYKRGVIGRLNLSVKLQENPPARHVFMYVCVCHTCAG